MRTEERIKILQETINKTNILEAGVKNKQFDLLENYGVIEKRLLGKIGLTISVHSEFSGDLLRIGFGEKTPEVLAAVTIIETLINRLFLQGFNPTDDGEIDSIFRGYDRMIASIKNNIEQQQYVLLDVAI